LFYPDVNVLFSVVPDALGVYADLGGGNRINTYSSLLERNPYVDMTFGYSNPLLDADVERVDASIGVKGRIAGKFTFDIYGGFKCYANALLDSAVLLGGDSDTYRYLPTYSYAGYNKLYAGLDWNLRMDAINFNGSVVKQSVPPIWGTKNLRLIKCDKFRRLEAYKLKKGKISAEFGNVNGVVITEAYLTQVPWELLRNRSRQYKKGK
jgi:hypothetical protein